MRFISFINLRKRRSVIKLKTAKSIKGIVPKTLQPSVSLYMSK